MQNLVEDFLQYLRHERGQAEHTQKTYAGLLKKFTDWAAKNGLTKWEQVELKHLMAFLQQVIPLFLPFFLLRTAAPPLVCF